MARSSALVGLALVVAWLLAGRAPGAEPPRGLTPAALAERLAKLAGPDQEVTDREKDLLADAADGKLSRVSLAEAALMASGVRDPEQRKKYLERVDALEKEARRAVAGAKTPFEKGERLLTWMHAGPLAKGYDDAQDHLPRLLDEGKFNCVSATTLYTILGRRLGLDVRGVHIQMHIWSIQYDGAAAKEVETTSAGGFGSKPKNYPLQREVGDFGILAAVYRNHVARLGKEGRHADVIRAAALAQALDPRKDEPAKDVESAFHNWFVSLAKKDQYAEAQAVVGLGVELLPGNWRLLTDRRQGYLLWAQHHRKQGRWAEGAEVLARAVAAHPTDTDLPGDAERHYIWWAQELSRQGDLAKAAEVLQQGIGRLPQTVGMRNELERVRKKENK